MGEQAVISGKDMEYCCAADKDKSDFKKS